ncbi:flavodoxin family protein [Fusibacter bizertensis]
MGELEIRNFTSHHEALINKVIAMSANLDYESSDLQKKVVFIIELDEIGECQLASDYLREQMHRVKNGIPSELKVMVGALIVISSGECYTKSFARKFMFLCNQMGCEFIGHPLVERVANYQNFKTWSKTLDEKLEDIEVIQIQKLLRRLSRYQTISRDRLKVLVLHAGHKDISNTLMFWDLIKAKLSGFKMDIDELHVEEGKISDCYGCSFETCMYYALEKGCFYGGFVVEDLYPKIEKADIVVWICPNYNDAISAKLMAVINRLTALYRSISFSEKYILSVIVSGNSGNDSVAGQLIGALVVNKGFRLPPNFAAMAIANDPGEIMQLNDLNDRVESYVNNVYELTNKIIAKK